jgi:ribose transport system permease protein
MSTASMTEQPAGERKLNLGRLLGRYGPILVLVAMIVVFAVMRPHTFPTTDNFINVLNLSALGAIIAMGLTFVLVAGDFDLSIGYLASLGGVLAAWLTGKYGWPLGGAVVFAVLATAIVGYLNGLLVTVVGINALIATLGIGTIVLGVNFAITGGVPVNVKNDALLNFTFDRLWGIPHPVYVMAGVAIVLWVLLNKTATGYAMQAVGGNRVAAEYSGIRVARIRRTCFVIAAACAGLTGVLLASQSGAATVDGGQSFLLPAFAAAFFGSAVLKDGQFHVVGTLVGILTVQVGFNGITLVGIESYYQYVFQGALLLFAVGAGARIRLRAER